MELGRVPYENLVSLVPPNLRIPIEKIRLDTHIGKGFFGEVYKATFTHSNGKHMEVAVKTLHGNLHQL